MADIVETFQLKYGVLHRERWGMGDRFTRGENEQEIDLPTDAEDAVMLREDVPTMPRELWKRVQMLYVACMERDPGMKLLKSGKITQKQYESKVGGPDKQSEVMVCFALSDDRTKWIVGVPRQSVGKAHVYADYDKGVLDIETGKQYKYWPPPGYFAAGTSHSHNTFGAYFSGTDDANELHQPGIHMVCGEYDTRTWDYKIATSVVMGKRRYRKVLVQNDEGALTVENLQWGAFVDANINGLDHITLPKKVWKYVMFETPASWKDVWEKDRKLQITSIVPTTDVRPTNIIYPVQGKANSEPLPGRVLDSYQEGARFCCVRQRWVIPVGEEGLWDKQKAREDADIALFEEMYGGHMGREYGRDWGSDNGWLEKQREEKRKQQEEEYATVTKFLDDDDTLTQQQRDQLLKEIMQFYVSIGRELRSIVQGVKQISFLVNERQALRMVAHALNTEYKFGEDHLT